MVDEFFVRNIEMKKPYLQKEHRQILEAVYKNAVEKNCIKGFGFIPNICQCMTFTEINDETHLELQVLLTCLRDLESMGYVLNVMLNSNKEYSYAITWLGLKYMELEKS